jgi:hypothetical protein
MNQNLVGSIYGRFSIKVAHFASGFRGKAVLEIDK